MKHKLPMREENHSVGNEGLCNIKSAMPRNEATRFFNEILPRDAIEAKARGISPRFENEYLPLHNLKRILLFYPIQFLRIDCANRNIGHYATAAYAVRKKLRLKKSGLPMQNKTPVRFAQRA